MNDTISNEEISYLCFLILSVLFMSIGLFFVLYNYFIIAINYRNKKKASFVLLLGSLNLFAGLLLFPLTKVRIVCWIPFLIDPGSWVLGSSFIENFIKRRRPK
jgi:hypothetical protein